MIFSKKQFVLFRGTVQLDNKSLNILFFFYILGLAHFDKKLQNHKSGAILIQFEHILYVISKNPLRCYSIFERIVKIQFCTIRMENTL